MIITQKLNHNLLFLLWSKTDRTIDEIVVLITFLTQGIEF